MSQKGTFSAFFSVEEETKSFAWHLHKDSNLSAPLSPASSAGLPSEKHLSSPPSPQGFEDEQSWIPGTHMVEVVMTGLCYPWGQNENSEHW